MKPQADRKEAVRGVQKDSLRERQQTMNILPGGKSQAGRSGQGGQGLIASGTKKVFKPL